jgi:hypothetical protein
MRTSCFFPAFRNRVTKAPCVRRAPDWIGEGKVVIGATLYVDSILYYARTILHNTDYSMLYYTIPIPTVAVFG